MQNDHKTMHCMFQLSEPGTGFVCVCTEEERVLGLGGARQTAAGEKRRGEAVSLGQSGEKKFGFGLLLRLGPGLNMTEAVSAQEGFLG